MFIKFALPEAIATLFLSGHCQFFSKPAFHLLEWGFVGIETQN